MAILSDTSLKWRLKDFIVDGSDESLINPASIDIRLGKDMLVEDSSEKWGKVNLSGYTKARPFYLKPNEFVLVSTYETIEVPDGFAMDLRLKSSRAREGYQHALSGWIDPGWHGIITMELSNITRYQHLPLYYGMKMAQVVIYTLDQTCADLYDGRYKGATGVEASKA